MRRLTVIVTLLMGFATPAVADDIVVANGIYSGTLRALNLSSKLYQGVVINDGTAASRWLKINTNGSVDMNLISGSVSFSGALPAGTNVIGHIICDSGCSSSSSPSYGAAFPATGTPIGGTDGTNMVAIRVRTSTPASGDAGWVVRPLMPCDGTNCMPAGDASARSIHVTVDNGSATATENGNLTLGTSSVAEVISVAYGQAITTPSTMTLGTNGNGMRATYALAGQAITQVNAPKGDWTGGTATATGTSNTSVVAALGAGLSFCLTDWMVSNSSATNTEFKVVDDVGGANTALTGAMSVPTVGGNNKSLTTPICSTANKALGFVATVGVTTLSVTYRGYKTKE